MSNAASAVTRVGAGLATFGGSEVLRAGKGYIAGQQKKMQDAANAAQAEQNAADAAAADSGPKAMAVRDQFFSDQVSAAGVQPSTNETDAAGQPLIAPRKRGASRVLYG